MSSLVLIKKLLNDQDGVVVCNPVNHNGAPGFPVSDINITQLEAITCIVNTHDLLLQLLLMLADRPSPFRCTSFGIFILQLGAAESAESIEFLIDYVGYAQASSHTIKERASSYTVLQTMDSGQLGLL